MNKNENGFSVVEALLIIVIVGIIGGVGYYVFNSQKKTNTTVDNGTQSQKDPQKSENNDKTVTTKKEDETSSWASFSPNSKLYTIKIPDGWVMQHQNDECDCLLTKSLVYKKGTLAIIETTQGGRDGLSGLFIVSDDKDRTSERFASGWQKTGTTKIENLEATKYYYEYTTDEEGIGPPKGSKQYVYYIPKDGKYIYISYSVDPGQDNNLELVEKSIQTLR